MYLYVFVCICKYLYVFPENGTPSRASGKTPQNEAIPAILGPAAEKRDFEWHVKNTHEIAFSLQNRSSRLEFLYVFVCICMYLHVSVWIPRILQL